MKIFISADMEGASGITDRDDLMYGGAEFERGRRFLTGDVNAAIQGAFDAGATEVVVNESHASMRNLLTEDLDPRAQLIRGNIKRGCMMEGLDETFAAVFFVGYHSKHGTARGIMNHAMLGKEVQNLFMNGEPVGEIAVNAAYAGQMNVPIALISGDQTAVAEAQALLPGIEGAIVKEGIERFTAKLLHATVAQARIRAAAQQALQKLPTLKPLKVESPASMGFEFTSTAMAEVCSWIPTIRRKNDRSIEFTFDDWRDGMGTLFALLYLAIHVADSAY